MSESGERVRETAEVLRQSAAARAEEERALFAVAVRSSRDAVIVYRVRDETILDVNAAWEKLTGYGRDEVMGKSRRGLDFRSKPFEGVALDKDMERDAFVPGSPISVRNHVTGESSFVLLSTETVTIRGEPCIMRIARDITEQRQLEMQLRHSQKMEAVGRLASGIAHDFNNILTVISSYSQLLTSRFPPDDPGRGDVNEIRAAANRAAALVSQLLTFSRKRQGEHAVIDVSATLFDTQKMLQRIIGNDMEIVVTAGPDTEYCRVDRGQLEQVLVNLAMNARDAMPNGGTLTFEMSTALVDEAFARRYLDPDMAPGTYVVLSVTDTGHGMDARTREHIFEPFFTTKGPGKGTGLGLSTAYGILKQHGGAITLASEVGRGSTFSIYLPRFQQSTPEAVPHAAHSR